MKTAMLQHIEHLKIMQNMVLEKSLDKELTKTINTTLSGAIENAEHFLETEKQQIIDAYKAGEKNIDFPALHGQGKLSNANKYHASTFYTTNKETVK